MQEHALALRPVLGHGVGRVLHDQVQVRVRRPTFVDEANLDAVLWRQPEVIEVGHANPAEGDDRIDPVAGDRQPAVRRVRSGEDDTGVMRVGRERVGVTPGSVVLMVRVRPPRAIRSPAEDRIGHPDKIGIAHGRPAEHPASPLQRHGRVPPHGPEQGASDAGDRVGVAAAAHRGLHGQHQVASGPVRRHSGPGHCGPGGAQSRDAVAVGRVVVVVVDGRRAVRLGQDGTPVVGMVGQVRDDVGVHGRSEGGQVGRILSEQRCADGQAPHRAGLARLVVRVRHRGEPHGGSHHP